MPQYDPEVNAWFYKGNWFTFGNDHQIYYYKGQTEGNAGGWVDASNRPMQVDVADVDTQNHLVTQYSPETQYEQTPTDFRQEADAPEVAWKTDYPPLPEVEDPNKPPWWQEAGLEGLAGGGLVGAGVAAASKIFGKANKAPTTEQPSNGIPNRDSVMSRVLGNTPADRISKVSRMGNRILGALDTSKYSSNGGLTGMTAVRRDGLGGASNNSIYGNNGGDINYDAMRARAIAPSRALYQNALRNVSRQKALQGGYSPGYGTLLSRLNRDMNQGMSDASINAEAEIGGLKLRERELAQQGALENRRLGILERSEPGDFDKTLNRTNQILGAVSTAGKIYGDIWGDDYA